MSDMPLPSPDQRTPEEIEKIQNQLREMIRPIIREQLAKDGITNETIPESIAPLYYMMKAVMNGPDPE